MIKEIRHKLSILIAGKNRFATDEKYNLLTGALLVSLKIKDIVDIVAMPNLTSAQIKIKVNKVITDPDKSEMEALNMSFIFKLIAPEKIKEFKNKNVFTNQDMTNEIIKYAQYLEQEMQTVNLKES